MVITVKRTKQVSQFEPVTIEWSQEIDDINPQTATREMLKEIDLELDTYLDNAEGDWEAFRRVLDNTSEWKPANMEDFQKLSPYQQSIVNSLKKAYKRSPEWKNRETTSTIPNEANRR